ncbi:MAG: DoxX family protein [Burkholderiales bacterium]|nr:DoxX family protein [Burkholderiales bacterium]
MRATQRAAWAHHAALLALCAAYLQGGLVKALDFSGAVAEMAHFGLQPAAPFAAAAIVLELGASALVIGGRWRWLGALALAAFTAAATLTANRYWAAVGQERFQLMNAFYEHIGLVGGFCLVAWQDLNDRRHA